MTPQPSPGQATTQPAPAAPAIGQASTGPVPTRVTVPALSTRRAKLYTLGVAAVLVGAGLAWLYLTSEIAATGRRIAVLDAERGDLLERRAVVLAAYAARTDPRALSAAATAQGFGPPTHAVQYLDVSAAVVAGGAPHDARPGSPLDIMQAAASEPGTSVNPPADGSLADLPAMLLSVGAAEPAAADEGGARGGSGTASGDAAGIGLGTGR